MPCVKATAGAGGATLESTGAHANPLRPVAVSAAAAAPSRKKTAVDESTIHSHGWVDFATEAETKDYIKTLGCKSRKIKRNDAGFALIAFSGKPCVGDMNKINVLKSGAITSGLRGPWLSMASGKTTYRQYIAYSNTSDISTERFFVRWWKRT